MLLRALLGHFFHFFYWFMAAFWRRICYVCRDRGVHRKHHLFTRVHTNLHTASGVGEGSEASWVVGCLVFCTTWKDQKRGRNGLFWLFRAFMFEKCCMPSAILPTTRTFATSTRQNLNILRTFFNYLTNSRQIVEGCSQNVTPQFEGSSTVLRIEIGAAYTKSGNTEVYQDSSSTTCRLVLILSANVRI